MQNFGGKAKSIMVFLKVAYCKYLFAVAILLQSTVIFFLVIRAGNMKNLGFSSELPNIVITKVT